MFFIWIMSYAFRTSMATWYRFYQQGKRNIYMFTWEGKRIAMKPIPTLPKSTKGGEPNSIFICNQGEFLIEYKKTVMICFDCQRRSRPSNWSSWEDEADAERISKNHDELLDELPPMRDMQTALIWSSEKVYLTSHTTGWIQMRVKFKGRRSKSWFRRDTLERIWVHAQYRLFWHQKRMKVSACAWTTKPSTRSLSDTDSRYLTLMICWID